MKIKDVTHGFTFIRAREIGKFLAWIAAQDFRGPINLASEGYVTVQAILDHISQKTGKQPILSTDEALPNEPFTVFHEKRFSMNMDKAKGLGYHTSNLFDWFWAELDRCIERARREALQ